MRQGVTLAEVEEIVEARLWLMICQQWLWKARITGQPRGCTNVFEYHVGQALDRVWEAQQRAA
jgi:hypothetical protein